MGVRGLATLVDDNKGELLSDLKLHDTRVVIDGSNLYHFLYYHYNIATQYGGDYDQYARKCRHFFTMFRRCNIEPYIVLDGGYDPDDRKLPAVLERMESRRLRAGKICIKGHGCVLPVLCYATFRQVLVELGIGHVSSTFEADREIAVLSKRWKCPALSNDSDFFIYGMDGGYVPLDYINMTLCVYNNLTGEASILGTSHTPGENEFVYMPVKYYNYRTFVQRFRKKESKFILPMFATLNGNDYIDPSVFWSFFAQIHVPKNPSKKACNLKAQTHMLAVLYWLDTMDTEEEALKHVFEHIPKEKVESVRELVTKVFNDYRYIDKFSSVEMDIFLENKTLKPGLVEVVPELLDFNEKPLPQWFVENLRSCNTAGTLLQNISVNRRAILNCQIENLREVSTYACSRNIRSVIYGTVIGDEDTDVSLRPSRKNCIEEYDRHQKNTKKFYVLPLRSLQYDSRSIKVPSVHNMPEMSVEDRKLVLLASLGLTPKIISECTDNAFLVLIGVFSCWIKNADPKITENHLNAMIIGLFTLHVRTVRWLKLKPTQETSLEKIGPDLLTRVTEAIESQDDSKVDKFLKHIEKHFVKPDKSSRSTRESEVIHGFSQFQACYMDTLYLNQVLMSPVNMPNPAVILYCTFFYNVCRDFDTRPKPDFYAAEILSPDSPMHRLFTSWKETVISLCKSSISGNFLYKTDRVKTNSKKKSKTKKQKKEKVESPVPDDSDRSDSESSGGYCDINNKFAMLGMGDD